MLGVPLRCLLWRSPKQFKALAIGADPLTHVVFLLVPESSGTRVIWFTPGGGAAQVGKRLASGRSALRMVPSQSASALLCRDWQKSKRLQGSVRCAARR